MDEDAKKLGDASNGLGGGKGEVHIHSAPKLYRRRWFMLLIFCFYSFSSAFQWIHLNIIESIIAEYYNSSLPEDPTLRSMAIPWLSMLYMACYIPLVFPATFLLDKKGLKFCLVIGSCLNALGAWIKCAAIHPDRFAVLFCGQMLSAIAQVFVLEVPAPLAAAWFGESEVSTATAMGVFGNQVGCAFGFFLPPMMVPKDNIHEGLQVLLYTTAGVTTLIFLLVLFVFQTKPPTPPSVNQMTEEKLDGDAYLVSLKRLFTSVPFLLLVVSYGINTGVYYAIGTLLSPIILAYNSAAATDAGNIGFTLVLAGVAGSVLAGIVLDKTKKFKETTLVIYFLSFCFMLAFTFALTANSMPLNYVMAGALGFFMTGYLPVGFELAAEISYPEPEGTSSGMLNASAQVFGVILTMTMTQIQEKSTMAANCTVSAFLFIGTIITFFIKADLKRTAANERGMISVNVDAELEALPVAGGVDGTVNEKDGV